jgi:hypothetical protein
LSASNQPLPAPSQKPMSPVTGWQAQTRRIPSPEGVRTLKEASPEAEEDQIKKQNRRKLRVAIITTYDIRPSYLPPG